MVAALGLVASMTTVVQPAFARSRPPLVSTAFRSPNRDIVCYWMSSDTTLACWSSRGRVGAFIDTAESYVWTQHNAPDPIPEMPTLRYGRRWESPDRDAECLMRTAHGQAQLTCAGGGRSFILSMFGAHTA
jgi:hypothetical protein